MKRFHWRLQQVLDVKVQRERALRSDLLALMEQLAEARRVMLLCRAELRTMLSDLAEADITHRMLMQEAVMRSAAFAEADIASVQEKIAQFTAERKEKTIRLIQLRKSQERLEQMREEARQEHLHEQLRSEQKEFDETAQIAFARGRAAERIANDTGA